MSTDLMHPSAAIRVCVNDVAHGQLQGIVYSQRLTNPLAFSDLSNLILLLDQLLDMQKFPQAFQRARIFVKKNSFEIPAATSPEQGMSLDAVQSASGTVATFSLSVLSRRDATWQGVVDWLDGSKPEAFSSVLDLIHLIDSRLLS